MEGGYYTWLDRHGNPVPPPTPSINPPNKRLLNIEINPGQNLGLMIRGGCEYGLGIYVTGVDHGSVAARSGLQLGDQLLEVNGRNFTSISHDKAVGILKSSRKMSIVASYVGKIPADTSGSSPLTSDAGTELIDLGGPSVNKLLTTSMGENLMGDSTNVTLFDDEDLLLEEKLNDANLNLELDYVGGGGGIDGGDLEKCTSIMGMIEEKARTVLNKSEHSRFTFYRLEYQQGFIPIQSFVRILLELLNTVEKYTLLTEVREIIRPPDLSSFDELIYNKKLPGQQHSLQQSQQQLPTIGPVGQSLQQQQGIVPPPLPHPRRISPLNLTPQGQGQMQLPILNSSGGYNETTFTTPQLLITHGDAANVANKLQHSKQAQQQSPANSCVRYKVRVQKTKPILGIAIEGGSNTPHRLPRIIDVNTEGSAYGSQLKPGQVLLSVDGNKLDGRSHEEIARSILESYVDMSKPSIEFVVVEAKASFIQSQQQILSTLPPPPQ